MSARDKSPPLGAAARLESNREALLSLVRRRRGDFAPPEGSGEALLPVRPPGSNRPTLISEPHWMWRLARRVFLRWWSAHPASAVLELSADKARDCARRHPGKSVAVALAGGALLIYARPWRMLTLGGAAIALARSRGLAQVANDLFHETRARIAHSTPSAAVEAHEPPSEPSAGL